jgi:hypothetical protein
MHREKESSPLARRSVATSLELKRLVFGDVFRWYDLLQRAGVLYADNRISTKHKTIIISMFL